MDTYLVGGAVRDALLGLPVRERDWVVVGASPAALEAEGFRPVGKDFPVFLHPETNEEYALARTERKAGTGHRGFEFHAAPDVTLEEDLERRDLTINAIAQAPDGTLIDPCGGRRDLEGRILRHVSPAFVEDPLRVLRVARFAARLAPLGFTLADETRGLMAELSASGELETLSPERVWREFALALDTERPSAFVTVLAEVGALSRVLPLLAAALLCEPEPAAIGSLDLPAGDDPVAERFAALIGGAALLVADCEGPDDDGAVLGEEARRLAAEACDALRAPKAAQVPALQLAAALPVLRSPAERAQLPAVAEQLDPGRRPERLPLLAAAADRVLRAEGAEELTRVRVARLLAGLAEVWAVDVDALRREGLEGAALGDALRMRRRDAVLALAGAIDDES